MSEEPRKREVRVNSADLNALKTAKDELTYNLPLGRVAREGAKKILEDGDNDEVTIA